MRKDKSDILTKIGKDAGFTTPDNYFESFTEKVVEKLPEPEITPLPQANTWHKVRPFIYMAAMFAGIWLMMKMFDSMGRQETGFYNPEIVAGFQNESNIDYLMLGGDITEYDILTYEDSVSAESKLFNDPE